MRSVSTFHHCWAKQAGLRASGNSHDSASHLAERVLGLQICLPHPTLCGSKELSSVLAHFSHALHLLSCPLSLQDSFNGSGLGILQNCRDSEPKLQLSPPSLSTPLSWRLALQAALVSIGFMLTLHSLASPRQCKWASSGLPFRHIEWQPLLLPRSHSALEMSHLGL